MKSSLCTMFRILVCVSACAVANGLRGHKVSPHGNDTNITKLTKLKPYAQLVVGQSKFDLNDPEVRECLKQYEGLDDETRMLLDEPALSCMSDPLPSGLAGQLVPNMVELNQIGFPTTHVHVLPDMNKDRQHILVVGPESSGTHFVQHMVGACVAPGNTITEFFGNSHVELSHLSLPQGADCGSPSVPVLDSFDTSPGWGSLGKYRRFFVDIAKTVEDYKTRGEKIKFVQVVRNPQSSFMSKMKNHCWQEDAGRQEHKEAFQLMLVAKDKPEVFTLCYEELMEKGVPFLKTKFETMGFNTAGAHFAVFRNANSKYSQRSNVDCTDQLNNAYMKLCPSSPYTRALQEQCS
jgi:hypothetical protein